MPRACSCNAEEVAAANVNGKIAVCFAPVEAARAPPGAAIGTALVALFVAKAKGVIFAQYSDNSMDQPQVVCRGDMVCVIVDYQLGYRIAVRYVDGAGSPVAKISPAKSIVGNWVLSPKVAGFSGRGPSVAFPAALKVCLFVCVNSRF